MKNICIFTVIVSLLVIILNGLYVKDIKSCIKAGGDVDWCINELAK